MRRSAPRSGGICLAGAWWCGTPPFRPMSGGTACSPCSNRVPQYDQSLPESVLACLSRSGRQRLPTRSEEHTSELQSRENLVCRLLLALAPPASYTLSLHDALPIYLRRDPAASASRERGGAGRHRSGLCLGGPRAPRARTAYLSTTSRCRNRSWPAFRDRGGNGYRRDRKSTRLNSSHVKTSYAVFCLLSRLPRPTLFPYTTLFRSICAAIRRHLPRGSVVVRDATVPAYVWGDRVLPVLEPRTSVRPVAAGIGPGLPFAIGAGTATD